MEAVGRNNIIHAWPNINVLAHSKEDLIKTNSKIPFDDTKALTSQLIIIAEFLFHRTMPLLHVITK